MRLTSGFGSTFFLFLLNVRPLDDGVGIGGISDSVDARCRPSPPSWDFFLCLNGFMLSKQAGQMCFQSRIVERVV